MTATAIRTIPAPALWLGLGGLLPFFGLSVGLWVTTGPMALGLCTALVAYGAVILSFMGGVHWGAAMMCSDLSLADTKLALLWGVTPSLIAWSATLFGGFGFAVLMAGFIAALQVDKQLFARYGMPPWLMGLRWRLTVAVVLMLAATVIGANVRG